MSTFHQRLDSVRDSLASLFKNRRRRRSLNVCSAAAAGGSEGGGGGRRPSGISSPQNVKRVMHITFDAGRQSFDGIPDHWQPYFAAASATADPASTSCCYDCEDEDSGNASMAAVQPQQPQPPPPPPPPPKELLSLTYDRERREFVDLPPHWRDRLERNNLLAPEFQRNPDQLIAVFAMMDKELRAMQSEGIRLDKGMFSSSPVASTESLTRPDSGGCRYVYEIEADHSTSSSEPELASQDATTVADDRLDPATVRQPSLVRLRAVRAPHQQTLC